MRRIELYHHPATLDEAVRILAEAAGKAAVIAGGTEIVAAVPEPVTALVDITRLGLDRVESTAEGIRIGACVTLQQIIEHDALRNLLDGTLSDAAHHSATRFIRNAATVGGNLVSSSAAWDMVGVLLAADASVEMQGPDGSNAVAIDEFLTRRDEHLMPGHVVTAVVLPRLGQGTRVRYERLARCAHDPSIVNVVARWTAGARFDDLRLVVGGLGATPVRLRLVEAALDGRATVVDEIDRACALIPDQLHPVPDVRGSAEYRAEMAAVLARRVLLGAVS